VNRAPGRSFPAIFAGMALWALVGGIVAGEVDAPATPAAPSAPAAIDSLDSHSIQRDAGDSTPIDSKPIPSDSHAISFDSTRVMLVLGGVVSLILVLKAGLRKILPGAAAARSTRAMQVISRCTISSRQQLLLIQVGKRLVVAGDSGTQLNPLCEIADPAEVEGLIAQIREEAASAAGRFDAFFGKARKEFNSDAEAISQSRDQASDNAEENRPEPAFDPASEPAPSAALAASADAPGDSFDPSHELNDAAINSSIAQTSRDLSGLRQKVRDLSRQIGSA
jgi:flagellar biogenesis protein FliO